MATLEMVGKAEELHFVRGKIIEGLLKMRDGGLQAGEYLIIADKKRLWECDGDHIKNFDVWIKNDIGITRSVAYNLMGASRKYGALVKANPDFQQIKMSVLIESLPYCPENATDEEKKELLYSLVGQTVRGVRNQLREKAGKLTSDSECEHEWAEVKVCSKCGYWG